MKKILIATQKPFAPIVLKKMLERISGSGLEASVVEGDQANDLAASVADINGLIVRSDIVDAAVMQAAPNLELVVRAGAGYDNVDVEYAKANAIVVENTPGQNANAVAELAIELMLASVRPLNGKQGAELKGKTLGVHGFGAIGRIVARLGKSFGMQVRVFDLQMNQRLAREYGVTIAENLEELYGQADFISLHIPDNGKTHASIGKRLLGIMKDEGVLVNTARAGVINEPELLEIFASKPGFRYATDVVPGNDLANELEKNFCGRYLASPKKQGAQTFEANMNAGMAAVDQSIGFFKEGISTCCVYKRIPSELSGYARLATQLGKLCGAYVPNPREIQFTSYGELNEYHDILGEYVLKGLFARSLGDDCTPDQAAACAAERNLYLVARTPDNTKGYGSALTVDFVDGSGQNFSSRGRIDENQMEASRIGEFKSRMPLDAGIYVISVYQEGPGMADRVGHFLSDSGFNRVTIGAGPNMENSRAQAFFQVEKAGVAIEQQLLEIEQIAASMRQADDVDDVHVIDLT